MAADDLTLAPSFTLPIEDEYATDVSDFANGAEQRHSKRANSISRWRLSYININETDKETLRTLFKNCKGRAISFLWTSPIDGIQYTVRFDSDKLETTLIAFGIYETHFDLKQVL